MEKFVVFQNKNNEKFFPALFQIKIFASSLVGKKKKEV